ncbi:Josephin-domain-containing protein [Ganoderma leucocontextum]|nr:Josephin-domain-containing protein [Ganoderma leucocontextum]
MATVRELIPSIYFEKQEPGTALCAQHALNSLLQEHYYSAAELAEIARELDQDENLALDDDARAVTSNNMDDSGFFSVQVMQKALQNFGLDLVPWEAETQRPYHPHPETQLAFILNHDLHWYTLRRFGNVSLDPNPDADPGGGFWFDLNSMNDTPQRVGNLHLGMFLHQARNNGYTIFAITQRDPTGPLALPRTAVDELFAYVEEPTAHYSHSYAAAAAAGASSSQPHAEGFEDEDMELQAALQASLAGGDYGDYIPQRFASSHVPGSLPQPPSLTASGVPIQRDYDDAIEVEDEEEDERGAHVQTQARVQEQPEPEDQVLVSMARQRAVMEQMRREQEVALQEQYDEEIARIDAAARFQRARQAAGAGAGAGEPHEDEDEILRRAMAESEAWAQAQGSGSHSGFSFGSAPGELDEGGAATPHAASAPAPTWRQHRVYDDEDAEFQAALRASLETVPAGFRVPSPPPIPSPPVAQPAAVSSSSSQEQEHVRDGEALVPPPIQRQPSSDIETESEAESEGPQAVQPSLDEIRRMRLARFGG